MRERNSKQKPSYGREKVSLEFRAWQRQRLEQDPHLRYLFLELTRQCNLSCKHCGSLCPSANDAGQLSAEEFKKFIRDISMEISINYYTFPRTQLMFCITGGEPLLREDLFDICSEITRCGFLWGMTTNGTLIDDACARRLAEAGMASVGVSLDGLRETHEALRGVPGCFDKAVAGIKALVKNGSFRSVQVITVVNALNFSQLEKIYRLVKRLGVDSWKLTSIEPIGEAKKHPELLLNREQYLQMLEFIRRKREKSRLKITFGCAHYLPDPYDNTVRSEHFICGAGTLIASVAANGDILACLDIDDREHTVQGNIRQDRFREVWRDGFADFRKNKGLSDPVCEKCKDLEFCRGGSCHTWDFVNNRQTVCHRNEREGALKIEAI